jgi:hypothetical protein
MFIPPIPMKKTARAAFISSPIFEGPKCVFSVNIIYHILSMAARGFCRMPAIDDVVNNICLIKNFTQKFTFV